MAWEASAGNWAVTRCFRHEYRTEEHFWLALQRVPGWRI